MVFNSTRFDTGSGRCVESDEEEDSTRDGTGGVLLEPKYGDVKRGFWLSLTPFWISGAALSHVTFCRLLCHRP